jgi:hypothetical protein
MGCPITLFFSSRSSIHLFSPLYPFSSSSPHLLLIYSLSLPLSLSLLDDREGDGYAEAFFSRYLVEDRYVTLQYVQYSASVVCCITVQCRMAQYDAV